MKIDTRKLDIILAQQCKTMSDLRTNTSPQTLKKVRRGDDVRPKTAGLIANTLGVPVTAIIEEVTA